MGQRRENHSGRAHGPSKPARSAKTKKQFVQVRNEREVLWIHRREDWARIHSTGLYLVCPDPGCSQRLVAKQNKYGTRYLNNHKDSSGCTHFVPTGGGGRMTDEHLWLQGKLREICRDLGYTATLEAGIDGGQVDLRVETAEGPFAFEVQRVSTDFTSRRKTRMQNGMRTVWFLPESDIQKNVASGRRRSDPLFTEPCVRLGYKDGPGRESKVMSVDALRAKVWQGDGHTDVFLRVGVTVGKLDDDKLSFRSSSLELTVFVQQILAGQRRWYSQPIITNGSGKWWAGWLLNDDVSAHKAAVSAAKEERRRLDEAEKEAAEAEARHEAERKEAEREQEREARGRGEAAVRTLREGERERQVKSTVPRPSSTPEGRPVAMPQEAQSAQREHRTSWWRRLLGFLLG